MTTSELAHQVRLKLYEAEARARKRAIAQLPRHEKIALFEDEIANAERAREFMNALVGETLATKSCDRIVADAERRLKKLRVAALIADINPAPTPRKRKAVPRG